MTADPRVLLFSQRNAVVRKWHASLYEFEDVIAEVDDINMLAPPGRRHNAITRVSNKVMHASGRAERYTNAAIQPVNVTGDYDLFFSIFSFTNEIPDLLQLKRWRERCDKAVCFILEVFTDQVRGEARRYLELLRHFNFDKVYVFNPRPAALIEEIVGCPVEYMATGVDAFRFSPYPAPPQRSIDLYEIGRHSIATHAAALDMARSDGLFYIYDTVFNVPLPNYRAHRELMAEMMKRSRYFFAYRAGEDLDRARHDDPVSSRFFEGIAGGPVLLGSYPKVPEFEADFDWPDAVIEIPYDAHNLRDIVADLDAQPERLERARTNNIVNTLRRHDWVHRWRQVLAGEGLSGTPAMAERVERLDSLAAMAQQGQAAVAGRGR